MKTTTVTCTPDVKCPYCGHEQEVTLTADVPSPSGNGVSITCGGCSKTFAVVLMFTLVTMTFDNPAAK